MDWSKVPLDKCFMLQIFVDNEWQFFEKKTYYVDDAYKEIKKLYNNHTSRIVKVTWRYITGSFEWPVVHLVMHYRKKNKSF